jgi:hypothetical protein
MTASIEVARQAEAPGALISRGPGASLQPRSASRQRDAILIVIVLAATNLTLQQGAIFAIVLTATSGVALISYTAGFGSGSDSGLPNVPS